MRLKPFLFISLVANVIFTTLKFIVATFTGSSAMVAEGIHSLIDVINQLLLLWGVNTGEKSPDFSRPLGYSKELYFWSSIVTLTILIIGGCFSFYNDLVHFRGSYREVNQYWSYGLLGVALLFNFFAVISAIRRLNRANDEMSLMDALEFSRNPTIFIILLSAIGDLAGIVVVWVGMYLGHLYQSAYYDSGASIMIGVILFTLSFFLIRQCKRLLMTEIISPTTLRKIIQLAKTDEAVLDVKKHFTMYAAPKEALLVLETVFKDDLDSHQVKDSIVRISANIKSRFPKIKMVHIDGAAA